jgi:transmembrane sensor
MKFRFPWSRQNTPSPANRDEAGWVVRSDGGLTEEELFELERLKAHDPDFEKAFEKSSKAWDLLDNISPKFAFEPANTRPDRFVLFRPVFREVAVAALLTLSVLGVWGFMNLQRSDNELFFTETRSTIEPWTQRLPDGSIVRLNANTKVEVSFTPEYRRVKLLQGEAHFTVAKDSGRPFRVFANDVRVQAVGTAFNVRLLKHEVDVLVTEGTVEVAPRDSMDQAENANQAMAETHKGVRSLVTSGQRATVSLYADDPLLGFDLSLAGSDIIEKSLSWQKSLLTFGGDSLEVIAESFEQKTGVKLIIADSELLELRIGGQFPSENVRGFLLVLRSGYGIQWFEKSDGTFVIGDSN